MSTPISKRCRVFPIAKRYFRKRYFRSAILCATLCLVGSSEAALAGEHGSKVSLDPQAAIDAGIDGNKSLKQSNGSIEPMSYAAQWKLGKMYAAGDGVDADDWKAYQYFLQIVQDYEDNEESTQRRDLPFVSSAMVTVGVYRLNGIPGKLRADPKSALNYFQYAATNFSNSNAQYNLAHMYLDGNGVPRDSRQAARWLRLAAEKGHTSSQALLGQLLFMGDDGVPRQRAQALMFLSMAHDTANPTTEQWVIDLYNKAEEEASDTDKQAAQTYLEAFLSSRRR